ncbi:endonuclease/exonuclease/phosphatase family metal-dependent hydrolase [Kribbella steppae]|uniref:Endonuclease/exonuclease/phosphatase family metal-dependent hydrolase n=1 Tax=Kribbella steppae TaxID=2512223 RepID=A0A4R2H5R6_9ACTN|nr:endonuclease/exonuclease/phosphatase family protein [Kribbella steppae]TCO19241.1 endonuclease/exonuclease/phosphatase family metal-dependent hydrolase [Kribbella steppae]
MRIRVLTMNVQHDAGDPRRTELINAELRRLTPDLVALQEVCYPGRSDQLAELVEGTGLTHTTHQADVLKSDWTDGTAFATRWPHRVVDVQEHRASADSDVHWWTLAAAVDVPELGELLFIQPATPWRLDQAAAREEQLLAAVELDEQHRFRLPSIIAGDLNATPKSAGIRFLTGLQALGGRSTQYHDAWAVGGDGTGFTWTVANPLAAAEIERLIGQTRHRRRIDYVFVGSAHSHPAARARVLHAELIGDAPVGGVWLSDHFGVLADLDYTLT